jgi:hypothetical protein
VQPDGRATIAGKIIAQRALTGPSLIRLAFSAIETAKPLASEDLRGSTPVQPRVIRAVSCASRRRVSGGGGVAVFEAVGNLRFGEVLPAFSLSE